LADSGALRVRRSRAHAAGDHSLCKRCVALRPPIVDDGPVNDPVAETRLLAGRLAAAHRADPGNALLARELRMTLQALMGGGTVDGELAEFLAGFSQA
jgi:hypothetical protein